ncbi:MAG: branched-chain amino acid ABC transporter permease [Chloroflexi bacterium]|nr:branched-chain amino acid ABC transporter permease [Chloroflexota bacterium]
MLKHLNAGGLTPLASKAITSHPLTVLLLAGIIFYLAWLPAQAGSQFLQFSINGVVIGAIYALMALGFTLVYGTVWFFDLSYGAMATVGGYSVFYFTSRQVQTIGRGEINNLPLNIIMGALIAGVVGWALYTWLFPALRNRLNRNVSLALCTALAAAFGVYIGFILENPAQLHTFLSPAIGLMVAVAAAWVIYRVILSASRGTAIRRPLVLLGVVGAIALGAYCGSLVAGAPGSILYFSWGMGVMLAGATGLTIYRGIYFYLRRKARSPLVMLVGSLGLLLSITAFISIIFSPDGRPLAEPFGSVPWSFGGAYIKPFQVFIIGVVLVVFVGLVVLLNRTSFGMAARAIGDDEEVARIVGINTPVIIAIIFFLGAAISALGGILLGEDIGIRPQMGLLLLLKGWIASVVGGIGNIQGALLGGFLLGMVENYGVWYVPAQWKDAIAFVLLILFLSFWPKGILPRA